MNECSRRQILFGATGALAFALSPGLFTKASASPNTDHTLIAAKAAGDSTGLQDYDIALFPKDESFRQECVRLARTNMSDRAEGYLLADGEAFPHITLTLFKCEQERLDEIWHRVSGFLPEPLAIKFTHVYFDPDMSHPGIMWTGFAVQRQHALSELQSKVFADLQALGISGRTKPDTYFPHLTWARCRDTAPLTFKELPSAALYRKSYPFELSIGLSNENGVYRR